MSVSAQTPDSELDQTYDSKHAKTSPKPKKRKSGQLIDGDLQFKKGLANQPQQPESKQERHSFGFLKTSDKKIGVLGLGVKGLRIVRNLLESKYNVSVYSRSQRRCNEVVNKGASQVSSPAEIIMASDITFCCSSGPKSSKRLFFAKNGVLKGLKNCKDTNKGYVELSSIDEETSKLFALEVATAGGAYLEAPMNNRVIAGAGSEALYKSCEAIFPAISTRSFFVSKEVGKATVMNLGVNMLNGAFIAAFEEAKIASESLDVFKDDLVDSMNLYGYDCPLTTKLRKGCRRKDLYSIFPLEKLQSQMQLGLLLKNSQILPKPVLSTANEVLKREVLKERQKTRDKTQ